MAWMTGQKGADQKAQADTRQQQSYSEEKRLRREGLLDQIDLARQAILDSKQLLKNSEDRLQVLEQQFKSEFPGDNGKRAESKVNDYEQGF